MSTQENQQIPQVTVNLTQETSKKSWIIFIIEALVFIMLFGTVSKCSHDKISRLEHNLDAYRDSIEYVELQNGELLAAKQSFILTEKELREELDFSKREIRDLENKLNDDIAYIARLTSQLNIKDTVHMKPDTVYVKDSLTTKRFNYKDNWLDMTTTVTGTSIGNSQLSIDNFNMDMSLDVGLTDDYKFWAKTSNPYINITDIKGAAIHGSEVSKSDKRLHHGIYLGFGIQYGLFGKQWDFGPQFGYAFMYSF